ncbi:hypothetical protein ACFQO7_11185 [Catellatospora aurea]|uniref:Alpha/beta hydrolase family protein n=1 Tax=Catellatospora aurea TaxID=1337874 RepID=A0ABW2GVB7_9ACTN
MAKIAVVHGIAQQLKGEETLRDEWAPALRDGLRRTGAEGKSIADGLANSDITFAFYGDTFRAPGNTMDVGTPLLTAHDLTPFEEQLLLAWWGEAAKVDTKVVPQDAETMVRTPKAVQTALRVLSGSTFFAGLGERLMIGDLVQVRRYFTEPDVRSRVQQCLADAVSAETRVIVAHSLGSVVAYEALCAHPEWGVHALVTLGSPLGVPNLVFDRLKPPPVRGTATPPGRWPGSVTAWTNVADQGDVVALVKDLRPLFGDRLASRVVNNGTKAHGVRNYLTAPETGEGILAGLRSTETEQDE